tara:strand:- start:624 stop:905 length:282 start_codon:yes stop_codon:yes gene_type:complete
MNNRLNVHVKKENTVVTNSINGNVVNPTNANKTDKVEVAANAANMATLELAKAPHVDSSAVSRIKQAISQGEYPVDVDKVTDALMDAYLELKS